MPVQTCNTAAQSGGRLNFSCLTPGEVVSWYASAKDKGEMLTVLSGLTDSTEIAVADFLGIDLSSTETKSKFSPLEEEKAYELYLQGACDRVIAEALGVGYTTVWNWRTKNGLKPAREYLRNTKNGEKERIILYEAGYTDIQIGQALNMSPSSIWSWRKRRNLPSNAIPPKEN